MQSREIAKSSTSMGTLSLRRWTHPEQAQFIS
jgi:hypothetical protein